MSNEIDWQKICNEINNPTEEQLREREEKEANKTTEEKIDHNKKMLKLVNLLQWADPNLEKTIKKNIQNETASLEKEVIKEKLGFI